MVSSVARPFATGSVPGWARQTGHVHVFTSAPYSSSQRQNIFVRVFRCACTSRPMTGSQLPLRLELHLRLPQRRLDVALDLHHGEPVLEHAVPLDQPELALARLELELQVADEHRPRAVEHPRRDAEHALRREHELRRRIVERPHAASLAGTGSNPSTCSSAYAVRKSVFSENCGPISWSPTGKPSESPQGTFRPGRPAMHDGIVSRSLRYIAIGFSVREPSGNATVGEVGVTSTSKRSNAWACSRTSTVRTFCACA